jgi:hypothetical protein
MATCYDDFVSLKPVFDEIREDHIKNPGMPAKHYMQQCLALHQRLEKEKETLAAGGMALDVVAKIPAMVGACRETFSQHSMITFPDNTSQRAFAVAYKECEALLYDLIEAMRYAFRNYPELIARIRIIKEGSSYADAIQDLNDVAVLGRENRELLEAVNYDTSTIDQAARLAKTLGELRAKATVDNSTDPTLRLNRARSFSLLKSTIDELALQARFILRADKKNAGLFRIEQPRKKPAKKTDEVLAEAVAV